jgi:hypothetical protein
MSDNSHIDALNESPAAVPGGAATVTQITRDLGDPIRYQSASLTTYSDQTVTASFEESFDGATNWRPCAAGVVSTINLGSTITVTPRRRYLRSKVVTGTAPTVYEQVLSLRSF